MNHRRWKSLAPVCLIGCLLLVACGRQPERESDRTEPASSISDQTIVPEPDSTNNQISTTKVAPEFNANEAAMTCDEVYKKAQFQLLSTMGDGYRHSLPLPMVRDGAVTWAILLCPVRLGGPEGAVLKPPTYLATFRATDGELDVMNAVTPQHFAQGDAPDKPLGAFLLPDGMTYEDYLRLRREMFDAADVVVPEYLRKASRPSDDVRQAARRFKANFQQLQEPPLAKYYASLGTDFFGWIDRNQN